MSALSLGRQSLWGILLFLDSILVIVFGGAVAMIASRHWQSPPPPGLIVRRHHPAAARSTGALAAHAPLPAEPAKVPPAAPKPAAAPAPAPAPAPSAPAAPTAPIISAAKGKSKARGVTFRLRAPKARSVQIVGAFIVHGGRKEMAKGRDGNWTIKLFLNEGRYRYFFFVDKKKTLDPGNPRSDRGASLLLVP